jgi:hypothetical protein
MKEIRLAHRRSQSFEIGIAVNLPLTGTASSQQNNNPRFPYFQ